MLNKKTIILIIIIVLAVGAGTLWYVNRNAKELARGDNNKQKIEKREKEAKKQDVVARNNNEQESDGQEAEKTAVEAGDMSTSTDEIDTSDWQTYRNEEYGFEVKYPKGWKYDLTDGVTFENPDNCVIDKKIDIHRCRNYINFSRYEKAGNYYKTVFEWREHDFKNANIVNFEDAIIKLKNINYKVIRFNHKKFNKRLGYSYYFIDNKNNGWEITIQYYSQKELVFLEAMLKSFTIIK